VTAPSRSVTKDASRGAVIMNMIARSVTLRSCEMEFH